MRLARVTADLPLWPGVLTGPGGERTYTHTHTQFQDIGGGRGLLKRTCSLWSAPLHRETIDTLNAALTRLQRSGSSCARRVTPIIIIVIKRRGKDLRHVTEPWINSEYHLQNNPKCDVKPFLVQTPAVEQSPRCPHTRHNGALSWLKEGLRDETRSCV